MVSVAPETWDRLAAAYEGGALAGDFERAFANGQAFLRAPDGLRHRRPAIVEWKGSHRAPGDEVAPIDLRIDHVYLISCKYRSRILINASPANLFERLLDGGHGRRHDNWYEAVAPAEHQRLYDAVVDGLAWPDAPSRPAEMDRAAQGRLARALADGWPQGAETAYAELVAAVATRTAAGWQAHLAAKGAGEAMLWRLLRMGSAPYFLLGSAPEGPLRLRVATPWDWRLQFRLRRLDCEPQPGGQPRVGWTAVVEDRHDGARRLVRGHVEIRWSHGRLGGNPEAKVYLDTPHGDLPGYFPLG